MPAHKEHSLVGNDRFEDKSLLLSVLCTIIGSGMIAKINVLQLPSTSPELVHGNDIRVYISLDLYILCKILSFLNAEQVNYRYPMADEGEAVKRWHTIMTKSLNAKCRTSRKKLKDRARKSEGLQGSNLQEPIIAS